MQRYGLKKKILQTHACCLTGSKVVKELGTPNLFGSNLTESATVASGPLVPRKDRRARSCNRNIWKPETFFPFDWHWHAIISRIEQHAANRASAVHRAVHIYRRTVYVHSVGPCILNGTLTQHRKRMPLTGPGPSNALDRGKVCAQRPWRQSALHDPR